MIILAILAFCSAVGTLAAYKYKIGPFDIYKEHDTNEALYAVPRYNEPQMSNTAPPTPNEPVAPNLALYAKAKSYLAEHLSLNDQISPEVGCAEAVSFILKNCGYPIPQGGIPSVSGLTSWMQENGFVESEFYGVGYVITGRNGAEAHIGICGENYIMSNTSPSAADPSKGLVGGKFQANFRLPGWLSVYPQTRYFIPPPVKNLV